MDTSKLRFNIYINWSNGTKGMSDGLDGATYKEVGEWIKRYTALSKKHAIKRFDIRKFEMLDEKGKFIHLDEVLAGEYEWLDTAGKRANIGEFTYKRADYYEDSPAYLVEEMLYFLQKVAFAKKEPESASKLKFNVYLEYSCEDGNYYYNGDDNDEDNDEDEDYYYNIDNDEDEDEDKPGLTSYFAFRKYIDELVDDARSPGYFSYFNVKRLDIIMPDGTETSIEDVFDGEYAFLAESATDREEASSYPKRILECIDRLAKGQDWFKQKQIDDVKNEIKELEKKLKSAKKRLAELEKKEDTHA